MFDTCGTGGDRSGTFNISSCAALVVAACGVRVAKHGNRSVSSLSGSADVFEALGVRVTASPAVVERCLAEAQHRFFFAPTFHPSMRHAAQVRRELGVRTAFNLLGPLTNPAGATRQLVGVPRPEFTELMARALMLLGSERAWVVHGADGIDEISTTGYTKISECRDGAVNTFYLHPADVGLPKASPGSLKGGDAHENARIIERVLAGERGAPRDVVLLNAGAALFIAGEAASVEDGILRASRAIDRGDARRTLDRLVSISTAEELARSGGHDGRPARRGAARICWRPSSRRRGGSWKCARRASRCRALAGGRSGGDGGRSAAVGADPARSRQRHRRVQAALAVARRAARGVRSGGDRARLREAGAAAISVLTEPTFFDGSLEHLGGGLGRRSTCRCCARTSSCPSTSCSRRRRPGPTRCC